MGRARVAVSDEAQLELVQIALVIADAYGDAPARRVTDRIQGVSRNLSTMPTRHMRVPYLRDRVADYRRALTGAHREIFTLSDDES